MKAFVQRSVFVLLALLAARGDGLRGQWKIVAPNLFRYGGGDAFAAMHVKDGIVWAGVDTLWFSSDTGKTWKQSRFTQRVYDINFFNTNIGVVGAADGVYLTSDGGQTWGNVLLSDTFPITSIAFGRTDSVIYALNAGATVYFTTNMGVSWHPVLLGTPQSIGPNLIPFLIGLSLTLGKDGTVYVFSAEQVGGYGDSLNGRIYTSTNNGQTWSPNISWNLIGDSYTLIADSCNANQLYLANEDFASRADTFSHIFVSTDAGASWQAGFTAPIGVISGNITGGTKAIYAGTMDSMGVLRSLDRGQTWKRVGGPAIIFDSRDIVAFNNNIVFAIDESGNIWATYNSGGDSVRSAPFSYVLSPKQMFSSDSVYPCQKQSKAGAFITSTLCSFYQIVSEKITGPDSLDYEISKNVGQVSGYDSLELTFTPSDSGARLAQYELTLENGTTITVPLLGYGIPSVPLSMSSSNEATNIVGGDIAVPITISNLNHTENINLTLHYDSTLQYQGSFDAANVKLDIAGEQWPGRSKLNIAQAQSGVIAGYARFNVFADSSAKPQVKFDSLDVLSASSPCEYTLPSPVTSTITPPSGCGTTILSEFLKDGQIPTFTVRPNPTMGDVELTSSLDIGDAEIEIFDMLGIRRGDITLTLAKDSPVNISMPESAGIYYLRVKSVAGISNMSVVVSK